MNNIIGFHPTEKPKEYPPKNPPSGGSAGSGVRSHMRGNPIYYDGKDWRYADDDTLANDSKPCTRCGHMPTPEGYDYCLGHIDGVSAACCGHGVSEPYQKETK